MKKIICSILVMFSISAFSQGFLHQQGQNIVDGNGNNVLLRGMGLGGWMIQEGYMMQTSTFAGTQREIRAKIQAIVGEADTEAFYQRYRDNGITKRDIDSLKAWGFNSVRLPMHYNLYTLPIEQESAGQQTWLTEGFERTDKLLEWCAANQMYLILDMHAAPGGQGKDANISDYDPSKPSLWESDANKTKMIALWRKLAERYKDSPWIGAYDLINEPNWAFTGTNQNGCDEQSNAPLRSLMVAITQTIREVDTNHMIIIEGNCWGNNYNGIFPLWDNNMTLSFHKYWNNNEQGSIQGLLNLRTQYNVPLWLGESGENSNVWFRDAIKLVESLNIGWSWWPLKKIESIAGPCNVTMPAGYQQLLNYWSNGGTPPSQSAAITALMQLADNYKIQNVTVKPDVIDAMFRQVQTDATIPYKNHPLPGKIYATEYDLGRLGFAYSDNDYATYHSDGGTYTDWNKGWSMRNDGVDIEKCNDATTNGFDVNYTSAGEWLQYTLNTTAATGYTVEVRYAGMGGRLHLEDSTGRISETITLSSTGSYTTWNTASFGSVLLKQGENKIKLFVDTAGANLNYLDFKTPVPANQVAFSAIDAGTNILGDKVTVSFNKELATGINFSQSSLVLKINGTTATISGFEATSASSFTFNTATPISQGDVITLTYAGTNLVATDNTVQGAFNDKPVANRVGNIQPIPGIIQAESFYVNNGLSLETTTDTGGGQNIGYTNTGDYLDYLVNINQETNYKIEYRYAGNAATGQLSLQLINADTRTIETVSLPSTGGWQTWQTKQTNATLPAGRYYLRLYVGAPEFNLNWVRFTSAELDDDNDGIPNSADLCANTPAGTVVDFTGCPLFTLPQNNFAVTVTGESCRTSNNGSISITAAANHNYVATLTGGPAAQTKSFTNSTSFEGLESGEYQVCITLPEAPSYKVCYDAEITQPADLAVLSRVSAPERTVEVSLYGSETYTVTLNGNSFTTSQSTLNLALKPGENNLEIKAGRECQGTYSERILLDATAIIYPNPVNGNTVYITAPYDAESNVSVEIFNLIGKRVYNAVFKPQTEDIAADVSALQAGVYMIKVVSGNNTTNSKIVKQ